METGQGQGTSRWPRLGKISTPHHAVHRIRGSELGPTRGFASVFFLGLLLPDCCLSRASAAAARSARIFARSASDRDGSLIGWGRSSSLFAAGDADVWFSFAVPSRCPCGCGQHDSSGDLTAILCTHLPGKGLDPLTVGTRQHLLLLGRALRATVPHSTTRRFERVCVRVATASKLV